ncbi:PASTA domain-containing protein [Gynuella sunshinyii]|uniref:PASTA domain-containing protein n=1 Tax=Gynuella sunshinyii YC6258 TaxID=1445510 RepID=A0A0C5VSZ0_9GAMM|nr:PASTA domain-containing protein [Gynuella sunshinyii]AJQ97772.1 hypothetical Protein YC6258_05744 [Gynuella sunshinyii YC6258]
MSEISKLVKDVVASPLADIIAAVGRGVADAQQALDEGSLAKTLEMYAEDGEEALRILREIGYQPTFYALPETIGEVKVALTLGNTSATSQANSNQGKVNTLLSRTGLNLPGIKPKIYAAPVDAGYANRYNYQAEVSAKLTFKIVPIPAPSGTDELRLLPKLTGLSAATARENLNQLDLQVQFIDAQQNEITEVDDNAIVNAQQPAHDANKPIIIRAGDEITLTLANNADE